MNYTVDQVLALSPDAASLAAAKKLTSPAKWKELSYNDQAVWGLCQGSGANPYQARIDLNGPAFRCSCPSRKFPCKHNLALFLMFADQPDIFSSSSPPDWVSEWLDKRDQQNRAKVAKAEKKLELETSESSELSASSDASEKKRNQRIDAMSRGLDECSLWLSDLAANGLSMVYQQGYQIWDNAAKRLIDAQVPGAAAMIQTMGRIAASDSESWLQDITFIMGKLFLLIKTFQRFHTLTPEQQADIRTAAGWAFEKDMVLAKGRTEKGAWLVSGESLRDNGSLKEQRIWLRNRSTGLMAMILSFAHGNQPLDVSLIPGTVIEAELAFYPGSIPLRALIKTRNGPVNSDLEIFAEPDIRTSFETYANALSLNPWITHFPMMTDRVIPCLSDNDLFFKDTAGRQLQVHSSFTETWKCLALSGGREMTVMGEWTDGYLIPLSCWTQDTFHRFTTDISG